ncbi:MAG: class II aldolase/adducin family protein [Chloroflexi bacterium]|nr:class II aldolase/adducin family protein [Chloroflexota bacterium]
MSKESLLQELITLSHSLGEPARDYVIIGEGNTSARIDDAAFWIKASGAYLQTIGASGFVEVDQARVMQLLDKANDDVTDDEVTRALAAARVDQTCTARPSVETVLHAVLYRLTDARFIGHTHPPAAVAVLSSARAEDLTRQVMPDGIVVCGAHTIFVPYVDPGVPLAREVRERVNHFIETYHEMPRTLWLQNHGIFALGSSTQQVEHITAMAVKHARIVGAALAWGEPHWLSEHDIARIDTRPDELLRRAKFK